MGTMRMFVAVWLPKAVLNALPLGDLREKLSRQGVRFTREERIHLTLRFLGDVEDEKVGSLVGSLSENLAGLQAPELTISTLGGFPDVRRPKVIWLGVQGDLQLIATRAIEATDDFAERPTEGEFMPHITIARVSPPSQKLGRALDAAALELGNRSLGSFRPQEAVLVQTLGDGTYQIVAEFPFT